MGGGRGGGGAADDLLTRVDEALAAFGARGVGAEPLVDALDVEAMVALGEQPELVAGGEVGQANDALRVQPGEVELRRVLHHREGLDGLPVDSGGGGGGQAGVGGVGNNEPRALEGAPDDGIEA